MDSLTPVMRYYNSSLFNGRSQTRCIAVAAVVVFIMLVSTFQRYGFRGEFKSSNIICTPSAQLPAESAANATLGVGLSIHLTSNPITKLTFMYIVRKDPRTGFETQLANKRTSSSCESDRTYNIRPQTASQPHRARRSIRENRRGNS